MCGGAVVLHSVAAPSKGKTKHWQKKQTNKNKQHRKAQKGNINKLKKLQPNFSFNIRTKSKRKIKHIDNKLINRLARHAGCPEDKAAGVYIHKKKNQIIKRGDKMLTIFTTSKEKMKHAKIFYKKYEKKIITFSQ